MGIGDEVRARRRGVRLSAQRLFTNRNQEKTAFETKLHELRTLRSSEPDWAVDLRSPRRNVLAFYGHGGIGKTRLSRELEQELVERKRPKAQKVATVRLDFSEPSARDAELLLFALRAGLSKVSATFPAFDTALAVYWARQHPAMSVPEFVSNQSVLGHAADRETLARDFKDWLHELIDDAGLVVGGTSRVLNLTWAKLRNRHTVRHLVRECPFFEASLSEDDLDQLRLHMPLLLAWDLAQLSHDVDVVVFVDTFERVTDAGIARLGDLEDSIARSAFFLRGVLFVVTSRNKLDWASARRSPTLEFAGTEDWPGLVDIPDDRGDQHAVGVLTTEDCESYLAGCLLDSDGEPAIEPSLRAGIARLSAGVPLYLDVAVNHYMGLTAGGQPPAINDFVSGIPELVMRLMEDLDDNESDLLRAAALLGVFDRTTLQAAVPGVRASAVENFLARSFVVDRGDQLYSVHDLLQISVRTQDDATSTAWSTDEWRAAEQRLVDHWSVQFDDDTSDLWRDRRTQALALWQLVGLYATTDVDADVLADIVMQVQLHGAWTTIDAARSQPDELVNERGQGLLLALDGIMARQIGRLDDADRQLSAALAVPAFTGNLARLTRYYLAETRDIHEGDPAPLFLDLVKTDDRIGTEARLAYAHSLVRAGDLDGALDIAQDYPLDIEDPEFRYRLHELLGVIRLFAGQLDRSIEHFETSKEVAEDQDSALLTALSRRHIALASCWTEPGSVLDQIDDVERLNRDLDLQPGIGQCLLARAIALTGSAPLADIDAILAQADQVFTDAGYYDDALAAPAVGVFAAAVEGDDELVRQRRADLITRSRGRRPRSWLAIADTWAGEREHLATVTWPQGETEAQAAWASVLERRRNGGGVR